MANFASVEIQITSVPSLNQPILIGFDSEPTNIAEIPKSIRTETGQFTIKVDEELSGVSLSGALSFDYSPFAGLIAKYPISVSLGVTSDIVIITANEYGHSFSIVEDPAWATITITPEVVPVNFEITGVTVQAADVEDRNTHARFNVAVANGTSPYDITAPVSKLNQTQPLFFDYLRNPPPPFVDISITDDNSDVATFTTPTIDKWTLDSVTVNEGVSGATVIANTSTFLGDISTAKEYSLDNINWQFGASFVGILPGNYTMYVRDNLGASYSLPFTVVGVSPDKPEPYFDIVHSNALRFVPDNTFNCDTIANWDNALFQQILDYQFPNVERRYYNQLISDCDIIDTQIRTNYDNVSITIYDCDDNSVLTPTAEIKKTNILLKDKRDCTLKQVASGDNAGKTFLYFTGGNIYEPDTTTVDGTYTNPSRGVFPFTKNGSLFSVLNTSALNGDYTQLGVEFDVSSGYYGIVLDVAFSGDAVQTAVVQTVYNEQVYNIWEFTLVGSALDNDKIYRAEITATDDDVRYEDIKWVSEPIYKLSSTKNTVKFVASNNAENTVNIDFTTGIKLTMRLPGRFIVATPNEESNTFQTQQGLTKVLKTTITRNQPFESDLIPYYIVEKLAIFSGLDTLSIQNVPFVKGEDVENTPRADDNNPFYQVRRDYQLDSSIDISNQIGLVTESPEVIGESDTIVIGT